MSVKESPLCQEIGPKKYKERIEKSNKFYDEFKAGKKDPKTGQFYYHIHGKNPLLKTKLGVNDGCVECGKCKYPLGITTSTSCIICSQCNTLHSIVRDKLTRDIIEIKFKVIE